MKPLFFLIYAVVFLMLIARTVSSVKQSAGLTSLEHNQDIEQRVHYWLASAVCAKKTGVLLALCGPNGEMAPIENYSLADDRGQAFLLGLWSKISGRLPVLSDLTALNILTNAMGVASLSLIFLIIRLPAMALGCLAISIAKAVPGPIPGPDIPSGYIGVVALALIPVVLLAAEHFEPSRRPLPTTALLAFLSLATAAMLRQPIALMGAGVSLCLFLRIVWLRRTTQRLGGVHVLWPILLCGALWSSSALLHLRSAVWKLPPSDQTPAHGFSQSLFHGLGTEPNPWGIEWSDVYGLRMMGQLHPEAPYLSRRYMQIMGRLYWRHVFQEPFEVLRIYAKKWVRIMSLPFRWFGLHLFMVSALVIGVVAVLAWRTPGRPGYPLAIGLALAFSGLVFLLQGVLGIPWIKHLYPIKWMMQVMSVCLVDYAWVAIFSKTEDTR